MNERSDTAATNEAASGGSLDAFEREVRELRAWAELAHQARGWAEWAAVSSDNKVRRQAEAWLARYEAMLYAVEQSDG